MDAVEHLPHNALLHAVGDGGFVLSKVAVHDVVQVVVRVVKQQPELAVHGAQQRLAQHDDVLVVELPQQLRAVYGARETGAGWQAARRLPAGVERAPTVSSRMAARHMPSFLPNCAVYMALSAYTWSLEACKSLKMHKVVAERQ